MILLLTLVFEPRVHLMCGFKNSGKPRYGIHIGNMFLPTLVHAVPTLDHFQSESKSL